MAVFLTKLEARLVRAVVGTMAADTSKENMDGWAACLSCDEKKVRSAFKTLMEKLQAEAE